MIHIFSKNERLYALDSESGHTVRASLKPRTLEIISNTAIKSTPTEAEVKRLYEAIVKFSFKGDSLVEFLEDTTVETVLDPLTTAQSFITVNADYYLHLTPKTISIYPAATFPATESASSGRHHGHQPTIEEEVEIVEEILDYIEGFSE